jgi:hypothetical protein
VLPIDLATVLLGLIDLLATQPLTEEFASLTTRASSNLRMAVADAIARRVVAADSAAPEV